MVCEASCAMDNRNKDMTERQENNNEKRSMPLERGNFTGMAIAGAMIVLGFVRAVRPMLSIPIFSVPGA